ncbi:hypothetical protein E2562_004404 [Oryza meyeriana var. granulata]|uniref:Uncharacterized protein n=1 Tax=Oryza meyeriana var. granulata TaxID=110450 RepID=A0A6G1CYB3_9ORYZ|nr:hypothetical protein E2562_004404 [Oryza meyeriana var. granulata]
MAAGRSAGHSPTRGTASAAVAQLDGRGSGGRGRHSFVEVAFPDPCRTAMTPAYCTQLEGHRGGRMAVAGHKEEDSKASLLKAWSKGKEKLGLGGGFIGGKELVEAAMSLYFMCINY